MLAIISIQVPSRVLSGDSEQNSSNGESLPHLGRTGMLSLCSMEGMCPALLCSVAPSLPVLPRKMPETLCLLPPCLLVSWVPSVAACTGLREWEGSRSQPASGKPGCKSLEKVTVGQPCWTPESQRPLALDPRSGSS